MTRLWPEGKVVEALRHPQCEDAGAAWDVRSVETSLPDWRRSSPGWSMPAPDWCTPVGFVWQGTSYCTLAVCNRWRVHTRWWEPGQTLWREYLKVLVAPTTMADRLDRSNDLGSAGSPGSACDEFLCLLYRDLLLDDWFLARIYD